MRKAWPLLLLPLLFAYAAFARSGPVIPSATLGAASTDQAQSGAPLGVTPDPSGAATPLGEPSGSSDGSGSPVGSRRPTPTGGIGQPASYCRQFCDTPEPRVVVSKGSGDTLRGSATWYAWHPGEAAAGPGLRAWLGADWRGKVVTVIAPGCTCKPVAVRLTDWCLCRDDRIVDLDRASFAALADPSRGIIPVLILEGDWTQ